MQASSETKRGFFFMMPGDGPAAESVLDVRSRMAVSILASIATIFYAAIEAQTVLFAASFLYALSMKNHRLLCGAYAVLLLMNCIAVACSYGLHAMIPDMPPVKFSEMLVPFVRMAVMLNVVLPLAFASRIQNLLTALQSLRLPFCLYLPATVMIRFIPTFAQDIRQVADTMKLRGFRLTPANCMMHPVLVFRFLFIPLLFRSLRSSEELGIAAEFKGMGPDVRRSRVRPYRASRWTGYDTLFVTSAVAVIVLAAVFQIIFSDIPLGSGGMGGMK